WGASTSGAHRAQMLAAEATGFVYVISMTGVTGSAFAGVERVTPLVASIREASSAPVCVGFGVRDRESARTAAAVADGVVVGSALVSIVEQGLDLSAMDTLVAELREGVDAA
ncbi:MAG: tryptophan synthase subunit alpha, partial [Myxococcota bacterium]